MPIAGSVTLDVYDAAGRLVRMLLADELVVPGPHAVTWDARIGVGASVATGVYLFMLWAGDTIETQKAVLVR